MANKRFISDTLLKAIKESMRFEEFMDKTDFESWFYKESTEELKELGQEILPYLEFLKNVDEMQNICSKVKASGFKDLREPKDAKTLKNGLFINYLTRRIKD